MYLKLNDDDKETLSYAVINLNDFYDDHDKLGSGPLEVKEKAGSSIWLHTKTFSTKFIEYNNNHIQVVINFLKKFQKTYSPRSSFGKVYIHRLKPGQSVGRHFDGRNDQKYFKKINRYQIFFNIPALAEIESIPYPEPNSLQLLNHREYHSYKNLSNEDFYFIVFDLYESA